MALLAAGSALVAGSSPESNMQAMQTARVRVLRAFYYDRKPTKVGDVIELPKILAAEVVAAKKAEFAAEPKAAEAPAPAAATETRKRDKLV